MASMPSVFRQIGGGDGRRLGTRNKRGEENEMPRYRHKMRHVFLCIAPLSGFASASFLLCTAQQPDDILPLFKKKSKEGYKGAEYFRLFALQK